MDGAWTGEEVEPDNAAAGGTVVVALLGLLTLGKGFVSTITREGGDRAVVQVVSTQAAGQVLAAIEDADRDWVPVRHAGRTGQVVAPLMLGPRTLPAGCGVVVLRAPTWRDVVELALFETMVFGRDQPQVTRRLIALLDDLIADLPEARIEPMSLIRRHLISFVGRSGMDDAPMARIALTADRQGLGGSR